MPTDPEALDEMLFDLMRARCVPVADGVLAAVLDNGVWVEVRGVLAAEPRVPGAVGAWLDTLPTDRRVIVPAVISERLVGMLERRGFVRYRWWDQVLGLWDDGAMARKPVSCEPEAICGAHRLLVRYHQLFEALQAANRAKRELRQRLYVRKDPEETSP